jgi:outer membrane protein assembly factor BamB
MSRRMLLGSMAALFVVVLACSVSEPTRPAPAEVGIVDDPLSRPLDGLGAPLWSKSGPWPYLRSPVVADGKAILMMTHGVLSALSLKDGSVVWQAETGYVSAAPLVAGGVLYVGIGGNRMCAVRVSDGQVLWRHAEFTPAEGGVTRLHDVSPLGLVGEAVVFNSGDGNLYALNREDGAPAWTFAKPTGGRFREPSHAVLDSGMIYLAGSGETSAVDAATRKVLWTGKTEVPETQGLCKWGDRLLITGGGKFEAISATDGRSLWRAEAQAAGRAECITALSGDRVAILGGWDDARVYLFDVTSGRRLWLKEFPAFPVAAVAGDRDRLWVVLSNGTLAILAVRDGSVQAEHPLGVTVLGVPVFVGDLVLLPWRKADVAGTKSGRGVLTAYRRPPAKP